MATQIKKTTALKRRRRSKPATDAEARQLVESRGRRFGKAAIDRIPDIASELDKVTTRSPMTHHPLRLLMRDKRAFFELPKVLRTASIAAYPTAAIDGFAARCLRNKKAHSVFMERCALADPFAGRCNYASQYMTQDVINNRPATEFYARSTTPHTCKYVVYPVVDEDARSQQFISSYINSTLFYKLKTKYFESFVHGVSKTTFYLRLFEDRLFAFDRSDLIMQRYIAQQEQEHYCMLPRDLVDAIVDAEKRMIRNMHRRGQRALTLFEDNLVKTTDAASVVASYDVTKIIDSKTYSDYITLVEKSIRQHYSNFCIRTRRYFNPAIIGSLTGLMCTQNLVNFSAMLPPMLFLLRDVSVGVKKIGRGASIYDSVDARPPNCFAHGLHTSLFDVPSAYDLDAGDLVSVRLLPYGSANDTSNAVTLSGITWDEFCTTVSAIKQESDHLADKIHDAITMTMYAEPEKCPAWCKSYCAPIKAIKTTCGVDGVPLDSLRTGFGGNNQPSPTASLSVYMQVKGACLNRSSFMSMISNKKLIADLMAWSDIYARFAEGTSQNDSRAGTQASSTAPKTKVLRQVGELLDIAARQNHIVFNKSTIDKFGVTYMAYSREFTTLLKIARLLNISVAQYIAVAVSTVSRLYKHEVVKYDSKNVRHLFLRLLTSRAMIGRVASMGDALFSDHDMDRAALRSLYEGSASKKVRGPDTGGAFDVISTLDAAHHLMNALRRFPADDHKGRLTATYMQIGTHASVFIPFSVYPLCAYWRENPELRFGADDLNFADATMINKAGSGECRVHETLEKLRTIKVFAEFATAAGRWSTTKALYTELAAQRSAEHDVRQMTRFLIKQRGGA